MGFFVFWVFLSILVGAYASSKKRSGVGWFFLSLIMSPLIAFIIVAVAGLPQGELKKCPKCAEEIKLEAVICRFCGHDFQKEKDKEADAIFKKHGIDKPESIKVGDKINQETIDKLWDQRERVRDDFYRKP